MIAWLTETRHFACAATKEPRIKKIGKIIVMNMGIHMMKMFS